MSIIGNAVTFGGGSGAPELLWTNPNPTLAQANFSVTLPTGYSAYLVEFRNYTYADAGTGILYVPFGTSGWASGFIWYTYNDTGYARKITSVTDGEIVFGYSQNGSSGTGSQRGIPTRIWGVKWTI